MLRRNSPATVAVITVIVLVVVDQAHWIATRFTAYNSLHRHYPFYVTESLDKVGGALLCGLAIWAMRRNGLRDITHQLGLSAPILPAVTFAIVCSAPMLIGFAFTRRFAPSDTALPLIFLTVFAPIVEEIEYRGFGVRQFQRGTRWPFWVVVWPSTALFGWGHIEQGRNWQEMAGLLLITSAGGLVFAWLLYRWQNLWIPIMLHIAMNLWWELFSVARTAVGGWFPFALQNLTMILAIVITLYRTTVHAEAAST